MKITLPKQKQKTQNEVKSSYILHLDPNSLQIM